MSNIIHMFILDCSAYINFRYVNYKYVQLFQDIKDIISNKTKFLIYKI